MDKQKIGCYIYNEIPGTHPTWTLAVFAVGRSDADHYVRTHNGGGKFLYQAIPGSKVVAACGATTTAASEILKLD